MQFCTAAFIVGMDVSHFPACIELSIASVFPDYSSLLATLVDYYSPRVILRIYWQLVPEFLTLLVSDCTVSSDFLVSVQSTVSGVALTVIALTWNCTEWIVTDLEFADVVIA